MSNYQVTQTLTHARILTIVVSIVIGVYLYNEKLTSRDKVALGFMLIGAMMISETKNQEKINKNQPKN